MVITVRDTGIGIPSAAMPHLFEKFFRVIGSEKIASGTGLGLTFCWQIVQAQRGHIEVNSQVDKGTEFIIHLPLRQG
jgi:two-component system, OmpR family, phosphate regulon sensor histidine kinase PhoR